MANHNHKSHNKTRPTLFWYECEIESVYKFQLKQLQNDDDMEMLSKLEAVHITLNMDQNDDIL